MNQAKLLEIATLELDCKIGKDRHFIAADRKNRWRIVLGLFSVIGSALIASGIGPSIAKLTAAYFSEYKYVDEIQGVLSHVVPLLVGISTAILGFFGLEKQTTQHRFVGNSYIEIARKARELINSAISPGPGPELETQYKALLERYLETNKEGESSPTNSKDSSKAMKMNAVRRAAIKIKTQEYDQIKLGLAETKKTRGLSVWRAISLGVRKKAIRFLVRTHIVDIADARRTLRR